jgi:hypothetical protein
MTEQIFNMFFFYVAIKVLGFWYNNFQAYSRHQDNQYLLHKIFEEIKDKNKE